MWAALSILAQLILQEWTLIRIISQKRATASSDHRIVKSSRLLVIAFKKEPDESKSMLERIKEAKMRNQNNVQKVNTEIVVESTGHSRNPSKIIIDYESIDCKNSFIVN